MRTPKNVDERFFQGESGKPSMMRLITYHGAKTARIIILAGLVLLPLELFVFQTATTTGLAVVGIGVGLFGLGEGAKAFQSGSETKS